MSKLSNLVATGVFGITITLCGLATVASATVINVDFNTSTSATYNATGAAVDAGTYWNGYTLGSGTSGSLIASDGSTATNVTFALAGATVYDNITNPTDLAICAPDLLDDYAGPGGAFTISHLLANKNYQLYLYSTNGGCGGISTVFAVGANTATATPGSNTAGFKLNQNYVTLTGTSDASGTLTGTFAQTNWGAFNGIQIVSVPEPGTLALLATGLFGLLCYAWRKRR